MSGDRASRERSRHVTVLASAIVGAGLCIGAGLYFGLRHRDPPDPGPTGAPGPSTAPAPTPTLATPSPDAGARATEVLERAKPMLVAACWTPTAERPARARFVVSSTFDVDGREIARGVSDVRGYEAPEVGQCLRGLPLDLTAPAADTRIRVEVTLELP